MRGCPPPPPLGRCRCRCAPMARRGRRPGSRPVRLRRRLVRRDWTWRGWRKGCVLLRLHRCRKRCQLTTNGSREVRHEQSHFGRPAGSGRSPGRRVGGACQAWPGDEGQSAGAKPGAPTACDAGPGDSLRRAAAGGDDLGSLGRGADGRGSSPPAGHLGDALLPAGAPGAAGTDDGLRAASQGTAGSGSRAGTAPPAARTGAVPARLPAASGPGPGHPAGGRGPGRCCGPCQRQGPAQG